MEVPSCQQLNKLNLAAKTPTTLSARSNSCSETPRQRSAWCLRTTIVGLYIIIDPIGHTRLEDGDFDNKKD